MSVRIIKPGVQATLQDFGRWGFQSLGVPVSGAMDEDAYIRANLLVGNEEHEGCIEFTLHGAEIEFESDAVIALCGGGSTVIVNDAYVPFEKSVRIKRGSVLKFKPHQQGCRCYLAIAGGLRIKKVLNSQSTYLPARLGGLQGRMLQPHDRLGINPHKSVLAERIERSLPVNTTNFAVASWSIPSKETVSQNSIRIYSGAEWNWLANEDQKKITANALTISPSSNRIGYRLQGVKIKKQTTEELVSASVTKGTVQLTPEGNLIILMADGQTTGGYPRIAQVAAVDLPRCAQLQIGAQIQFQLISFAEAEDLFLRRAHEREETKRSITTRFSV